MSDQRPVCQICGKPVQPEDAVPWLTGVAHVGCKQKTEGRMREESETIFGHEHPPL